MLSDSDEELDITGAAAAASEAKQEPVGPPGIDVEILADKVYRLVQGELRLERARGQGRY